MSLVDALLGFALAYSATYVLYCWLHAGPPARDTSPPPARVHAQPVAADLSPSRRRSSSAV